MLSSAPSSRAEALQATHRLPYLPHLPSLPEIVLHAPQAKEQAEERIAQIQANALEEAREAVRQELEEARNDAATAEAALDDIRVELERIQAEGAAKLAVRRIPLSSEGGMGRGGAMGEGAAAEGRCGWQAKLRPSPE